MGSKGRGGVSFVSQGDESVVGKVLHDDAYRAGYFKQIFASGQVIATTVFGYGDPTAGDGDTNFVNFPGSPPHSAAYNNKGAQSTLAPFNDSGRDLLNAGLSGGAGLGVEYMLGSMAGPANKNGLTVAASNPSAFVRLRFSNGAVANVEDVAVGWRLAEAFQGSINSYNDLAVLDIIGGVINTKTILNGDPPKVDPVAGAVVADGELVTLETRVDALGNVTYLVNGSLLGPSRFKFDDGDLVAPIVFFLQGAGASDWMWRELAVGRLWHERNSTRRDRG